MMPTETQGGVHSINAADEAQLGWSLAADRSVMPAIEETGRAQVTEPETDTEASRPQPPRGFFERAGDFYRHSEPGGRSHPISLVVLGCGALLLVSLTLPISPLHSEATTTCSISQR